MPKDYELTLVVDTQLAEGSVDETVKRYESLLGERGAIMVNIDRWGTRKLAYEIQKRQQGDYTLFQFQAEPSAIAEIDRACRLDESILRHLVILAENGFQSLVQADVAIAEEEEADDIDEASEEEEDEA